MSRVRPAAMADCPALARLFDAYFDEFNVGARAMTEAAIRRDGFGKTPRYRSAIAEDAAGQAIGFAMWCGGYDAELASPGGYLLELYVTPLARRKGVASRLLAHVAHAVRADGGSFLFWGTATDNRAARALYDAIARRNGAIVLYSLSGAGFERLADGG